MSQLSITSNLDLDPWTDLREAAVRDELHDGIVVRIGMLPAGMSSGKAAVQMAGVLRGGPNAGQPFVVELSWAMFQMAYAALRGTPTAQMEDL